MSSEAPATATTSVTIPVQSAERLFATFEKSARRWDVSVMNRSISRPMNLMNSMLPF